MKHSFTFYLVHLILKLKGFKKVFSKDPIDYKKVRKEDVFIPKGNFFRENILRKFKIVDSQITEISTNKASEHLILFFHGGAFISGPAQHHWETIKTIAKETHKTVWMCAYPKAPETKIIKLSNNIDAIYHSAISQYDAKNISIIGDSAGGTIATTLVQRLIKINKALPSKIILVSPIMDSSMSNPDIDKIDITDPMLSKIGVRSAKKMSAGSDLKNEIISPLYGSFENFPKTILFAASNDISYPDQILAAKKMKQANTKLELIDREDMPHIWPFLPAMKESKIALSLIIERLKN